MIVCIYCKGTKEPSREHALQRALGGDLVFRDVWEDCNRREFSVIDQALAERSFIGFQRVGSTPPGAFDVKLGGDHFLFHPPSGLTLEVAVRNHMRSEVYLQVHAEFNEDGTCMLRIACATPEDSERLSAYLEATIKNGTLDALHAKIGPDEAGSTPRFVMHREADGFLRGQSQEAVDQLRKILRGHWSEKAPEYLAGTGDPAHQQKVEHPVVRIGVPVDFNQVNRAVAKVAFNVMASKLGPDFALRPEFDPIREYIRGRDVRLPEVGPDEIPIDSRFVRFVDPGGEAPIPCDAHAVALFGTPYGLCAWVTLYRTSHFLVRLSPVAPRDLIPRVHVFSATREGNSELDLEEMVRRIRDRSRSDS